MRRRNINLIVVALILASFFVVTYSDELYDFFQNKNAAGEATTGTAKVNILTLVAINVTTATIDFGNGSISVNTKNCTITSENKSRTAMVPAGCFNGTVVTAALKRGFNVANIGNVAINVSIKGTKNYTAGSTNFWGVAGGKYMWRCTQNNGNATSRISTYTYVDNRTNGKICVSRLNVTIGSDGFTLHVNLTIPDTASGQKTDTVTFTALRACSTC